MPSTIVFYNEEIIGNRDITLLLKSTGIEQYYLRHSLPEFIKEKGFGYRNFLTSIRNLKKSGIILNNLSFKVEEQENDLLFFAIGLNRYRQVKWLLNNNFKLQDSHLENLDYFNNEKRLSSLNKYVNELLLKDINVVDNEKWISFLIKQKDSDNLSFLQKNNKLFFTSTQVEQIMLLKDKKMNIILETNLLKNILKSPKVQKNRL
ncbi:TPA: hypothetical protein NV714_002304 [Escherichia coli]|nr:hypothetical protein [Escherichia coli]